MIPSWAVVLSALVYLCLLFAIAHWGDGPGRRLLRRRARPTIYALALAVYCTSWTFYGSVGLAGRSGLDFLAIYVGPILVVGLGVPLVARVVRIAKAQNITSVADFVAARYGKSERVAALVTAVALVGTLPYVALQLKAVSASLGVFLQADGAPPPPFGDLALVVALTLAGFAIAFGTRHADATEHQDGLVLAVAVESVVKLAAFLLVGLFVTYGLFAGFSDLASRIDRAGPVLGALGPTSEPLPYATLILLSASAALLLPRQFHMTVVENRSPADLRRAAWMFPAYLVAINVFVVPLALAGHVLLPPGAVDGDMTVLALPLGAGSGLVALATFLGGLSAATAMVIVDTVAVSVMVSNHLVLPLVLRRRGFAPAEGSGGRARDLGGFVLTVRRLSIVAMALLAYAYHQVAGEAELASIGLLSFAAIAQIAPAFLGGLLWRRGTALGASVGLAVGFATWAYALLLPTLVKGTSWAGLLVDGPFGVAALRPTALGGLDLPPLAHGVAWSLGLNLLAFAAVSLLRPAGALERIQASAFVGETPLAISPSLRLFRATVTVDELTAAVGRFLGADRTAQAFASFARSRGLAVDGRAEADIHLLRYAEHLLASAIGAASSRLALSLLLRRRDLSAGGALRLLDEAAAAMQHDRDLLQHALDHAQQGMAVMDRDLRLLCWNKAFVDLSGLRPELVRLGVGLEEIVRRNAEAGGYGPGPADELVAQRLHSMLHEAGPVRVRLAGGRTLSVRTDALPGGGFISTYTDVSGLVAAEAAREREHETLEKRVRERTEELLRLNQALVEAKRAAEEANASKTRFLAAASHDILQPLHAARLYAATLAERAPASPDAALAGHVDASLDAVEEVLTTLLDISRLDSGALKPELSTVPLAELFDGLAREFGPTAAAKGLTLRFAPTSLAVRTDRRLLRRLARNLVSNALKYTAAGRVLVGVRRAGGRLRLEVWDTGMGIPASQQAAVFEEFRRLAEGARAAPGLGLGLSIVERIATALGTSVRLRSEPGRGSVFALELPVAAPEPAARVTELPPRRRGPTLALRVLAVDNEPAVLGGMRTLLEGWGCAVATASGRDEALRAAAEARPDVALADYHLDDGDGLDVVAALRAACGGDLPAVLITADRSPAVAARAAEAGVAILGKPLKPAALRALLGSLAAPRAAAE